MSSGKPSAERYRSRARRVARLASAGMTTNEIAELVGVEPDRVKTLRELGERLLQLNES